MNLLKPCTQSQQHMRLENGYHSYILEDYSSARDYPQQSDWNHSPTKNDTQSLDSPHTDDNTLQNISNHVRSLSFGDKVHMHETVEHNFWDSPEMCALKIRLNQHLARLHSSSMTDTQYNCLSHFEPHPSLSKSLNSSKFSAFRPVKSHVSKTVVHPINPTNTRNPSQELITPNGFCLPIRDSDDVNKRSFVSHEQTKCGVRTLSDCSATIESSLPGSTTIPESHYSLSLSELEKNLHLILSDLTDPNSISSTVHFMAKPSSSLKLPDSDASPKTRILKRRLYGRRTTGLRTYLGRKCQKCTCLNCLSGQNTGTIRLSDGTHLPILGRNLRKVHLCELCGKTYGKTSHLKAHLRWHNDERPFRCDYEFCNRAFTRSDELQRHVRTHTGEKRFVCNYCDKRFMRSDHLNKHKKTHSFAEYKAVQPSNKLDFQNSLIEQSL